MSTMLQDASDFFLARAFTQAANPMLIVDKGCRCVWVNHAYEAFSGTPQAQIRGTMPEIMRTDFRRKEVFRGLWQTVFAGATWVGELMASAVDAGSVAVQCVVTPLQDGMGRPAFFLVTLHDVSHLRKAIEKMAHCANHDPLTGLGNRTMLDSVLTCSMAFSRRHHTVFALLYIDLDGFKAVNDTYGHHAGDALLVEISRLMTSIVRDADTVCRLGGDEFAIVLDQVDAKAGVVTIASKLLDHLRAPVRAAGLDLLVGASIGVAIFPDDGETVELMMQHADAAMYCAKKGGKNRVVFYSAQQGAHVPAGQGECSGAGLDAAPSRP